MARRSRDVIHEWAVRSIGVWSDEAGVKDTGDVVERVSIGKCQLGVLGKLGWKSGSVREENVKCECHVSLKGGCVRALWVSVL